MTPSVPIVSPMLATAGDAPLVSPSLVYEPKYDGIRAIVSLAPGDPVPAVSIRSRLGNEKRDQFPELAAEFARFARGLKAPLVLDGEVVALDERGEPTSFQRLQGRLQVKAPAPGAVGAVAFVAFDLLRDGAADLTGEPLVTRRARLERVFTDTGSPALRLAEQAAGDARALYQRARARGWEGLVAKRAASRYRPGKRSADWVKLKLARTQEFVVGGWTEPRGARAHLGALLLGVYDRRKLVYVGHVGTGFDDRELAKLARLLDGLAVDQCPFDQPPPDTNDTPHWVKPALVAQVKFTEWTDEGRLRHPSYLGLRDDVKPKAVRREGPQARGPSSPPPPAPSPLQLVLDQLADLEARRTKGVIVLPDGETLEVGNLEKVFWPDLGLTKGDLLRYYVRVSPFLLPVVEDRPLVMKRYPNGVTRQAFYQQRAPEQVPRGVRVERLEDDDVPARVVGGSLKTLLYLAQLAAVSQDPWFSRVQSPDQADFVAIDLDPMPGVSWPQVLDVARWVRDELAVVGATGYPKTSGSKGLHIFVPLPPGTPYEAGLLWCQIVATMVAARHPKEATVERSVNRRGAKVYVDYLQNIHGKTLACAYSARSSDYAGASTPLSWDEVDAGVDRRAFTIRTLPDRLREVGDLWAALRREKGVDLGGVERYRR